MVIASFGAGASYNSERVAVALRRSAATRGFWLRLRGAWREYSLVTVRITQEGAPPALAAAPLQLGEYGQVHWHTCAAGLWVLPADATGLVVTDCFVADEPVSNPLQVTGFDECRQIRCREDERFDVDKATRWVIANRSWPMEGIDADQALADHALAVCAARISAEPPAWAQIDAPWCAEVGPIPDDARWP